MSGEPILIVDDNPVNMKLARVLLEGEGYQVRSAESAELAFASVREVRPRLILMDIQMPGMDGLEATRRLKADPATKDILVIALTAYAMKGDREKALEAGCDAYVTKPIDTRVLPGLIADLLRGTDGSVGAGPAAGAASGPQARSGESGPGAPAPRAQPGEAPRKSGPARILVIEDSPTYAKLAAFLLKGSGHVVLSAGDAREGLRLATAEKPDLILTDMNLPDGTGYDVLERLRAEPATAKIPTVALTADRVADPAELDRARGAGFAAYGEKPVNEAAMREMIGPLLGVPRPKLTDDEFLRDLLGTLAAELRAEAKAIRPEVARLRAGGDARAAVDALYRSAHTLKGASGAVTFPELERRCRGAENRIALAKHGGPALGPADLDTLDAFAAFLEDAAVRLEAGEVAGPAESTAPTEVRRRVLAVEDSPTQAAKLRAALASGGYASVEARTGEDALRIIANDPVDVVVSDVMMPGSVDGYELCRRVKAAQPDLPFILLTSLSDPLDVIRGLEVGADSFLTKPYQPEHLLARLEVLFATRRERAARGDKGGVIVRFLEREFVIQSGREQILDLLITIFDDAVRQNRQLIQREEQLSTRTAELETALKALEDAQEELARKERLAVLGKLSGSVGHELRNPLGVMTNAVYFLKLVLKDPHEKVVEYLDILKNQIQLSEKIVADLLDFARIKPPQRTTLEVKKLIDDQLARVAVPANVKFEATYPSPMPKVELDAVQVGQVVLNLLTNGVQAMEEGGGTLTVTAAAQDGKVTLAVQDTGPGVAEENREKIFEPLFTTKARGIGLGLAVSRSLAQANGGALLLAPAAGSGARFELVLPLAAG